MLLDRRTFIAGSSCATLVAVAFLGGFSERFRQAVIFELTEQFGANLISHSESQRFIEDFVELEGPKISARAKIKIGLIYSFGMENIWPAQSLRDKVLKDFISSTNVILHLEDGRDFFYSQIFRPYGSTCGNMISSFHL